MATRVLNRHSLPWIVAVPLMAAGTIVAHSVTAISGSTHAETSTDTAERVSHGAPSRVTVLIGFTLALIVVSLVRCLLARRRGGPSATLFFVLPPLAFLFAELLERGFGAESFPFQPSLEPRLLLGLALQVPFGVIAFFVARFLLRAIELVVAHLAEARPGPRLRASIDWFVPVSLVLPRIPVLALGYQERGPPQHR